MKRIIASILLLTTAMHFSFAQELVKSFQPTMYVNFKAGYQVSDSIVRYFFTSSDSKHSSNHLTYSIDHNLRAKTFVTRAVLDSTQQFSGLTAAYDLFHLGLPDGSSMLGSNGFECDITISDLARVAADGTTMWSINWGEIFFNEFITSIGLVDRDILIVNVESNTPFYFNLNGQQEYFGTNPPAYFNIVSTGNHYFGTNGATIYKLNGDFEIIDSYSGDTIRFFKKADHDLFLVGTDEGIALLDTALNVVASTTAITNIISGVRSLDQIWVVDHQGLHQLDINLNILKTYLPEPQEVMKHVSAIEDTIFVASDYDGLYHRDFVLRKYLRADSLITPALDVSIENVDCPDNVIREIWNGYPYAFTLRFDSLAIDVFNHSEDTITSCIINCDWSSEIWCLSYYREWHFDSIELLPQEMVTLELGAFTTDVMYYGAPLEFCFWVDYANGQPDVNPGNDLLCGDADIINQTGEIESANGILLFPNPAQSEVTISNLSQLMMESVMIYDNHGKIVKRYEVLSSNITIPVDNLLPGLYWMSVISRSGTASYKSFVKQ